MDIKRLLDQPNKLPSIPRVTQQLIASFSSEDASVHEIASQLAADPALSAKLLRLANSAYFHVSRSIGTVDDALRMLGFVMVRNLVLGNSMAAAFRNTQGIDLKQFWRYNLYTASAARWLAGTTGANADLAFTVGLLHSVGQLQMHAAMAPDMLALNRQIHVLDGARAALEKKSLGFHHGEVASELAQLWRFPDPIVAALRDVPDPLAGPEFCEAAAWVHMGAWRARSDVLAMTDEERVASYPSAVGKRLGLAATWALTLTTPLTEPTALTMPAFTELTEGLEALFD